MENETNNNDNSLEAAKQLISAVKQQFEEENEKLRKYRDEFYKRNDFSVRKFFAYNGPNFYLDRQALVFNIFIAPAGETVEFFKVEIIKQIPTFEHIETPYVIDLFTKVLLHTLKMDIDLFINKYSIGNDGDDYVVAIEYLDKYVAEDAVYLVSEWFRAIQMGKKFDFNTKFLKLQDDFGKTLFGGPTIYSLVEAGLKTDIPVFHLFEENEFQWGYGKKQLRGRSTTFSTDGIKDTEFTMFKDMVGDFLMMCGFPTPVGKNCFTEEDVVKEALNLGFPVVVKPVAGHKGQGVTTGIESEEEVKKAYNKIVESAKAEGVTFEGALVQQQVYGTDHRLLSVSGKFVAALERVPAFVDGDGENTIEKLIAIENDKEIRLDNARSPLCKIKIDDNLIDFLKLQKLSLDYIPKKDEKIILRRVANISAGGVSINVTANIHPDNVQLVEDIAGYFNVKCLGIDVLAADISKSWKEGNFGIIEINAGPGVFMHLAPAYGGSIDVPAKIMESHFPKPGSARIPIIATNKISENLISRINSELHELKKDLFFAYLTDKGVHFNGRYFHKNEEHDQNVKIILRNPKTEFALFTHTKDDIYDFGILHIGADIVILDDADYAEEKVLKEQLLPGGTGIEVIGNEINVWKNDTISKTITFETPDDKEKHIMQILEDHLADLINKYE
jgi:cyanophycin synthetase